MTCKICGSSKVKHKFDLDGKLGVYSCDQCQVQFMDPQLSDAELTELYSETYYKSWGISGDSENESSKQMKIATFLLRLREIQKHVPSGKILDIGCATGFLLEAAASLGYDPYGIELSEYSASMAKKKFGSDKIFHGKLEECDFPPKSFNVITMFDLIEHVRVPAETLAKAADLLAPGGVIVITTPDNSSLSNKVMGRKWTHYKKEHFYYFDLKSLNYISEKSNLKIIHSESSKKALNLDYLHTQFNTYRHWLFTPFVNIAHTVLPKALTRKNIYLGIGEITVIIKKK